MKPANRHSCTGNTPKHKTIISRQSMTKNKQKMMTRVNVAPLNNLATLYMQQGKYSDAEQLYLKALSIRNHMSALATIWGSHHSE